MRKISHKPPNNPHKEQYSIAQCNNTNTDFNQCVAKFVDKYARMTGNDEWMDEFISYLNKSTFPTSVPNTLENNQFAPMGYGFHMLNNNPMASNEAMPVISSMFNNSASVNTFNPQYFGGSSIKNVGSTNVYNSNGIYSNNNGIAVMEAFDGRSGTITPGGLLHSFDHSPAQNIYQQKPCYQNSYNAGFPMSVNDVQPNFQNNPDSSHFLGPMYNTQTSKDWTVLQPQVYMPGPPQSSQWDGSNWFKLPRLVSAESVQGQPLVGSSQSNLCGQVTTIGMACRKRKCHFGPPHMESSKRKSLFEPPSNESWVGSGTLMDVLNSCNMPLDLPPLEQSPNSSKEDGMGNEESSQVVPNVPSGTLLDVYNSFINSSGFKTDALSPKVNNAPEEKEICVFNYALDDYEAVMEFMESSVFEEEPISTPFDDNWPEVEVTNAKSPSAALADNFEGNKTGSGSMDIETPNASLADLFEDNGSGLEVTNAKSPSAALADDFEGNGIGSGSMDIETPNASLADLFEDNGSGLGSGSMKKQSASLADSLTASQIKEHLSSFIQPKKDVSGKTTPSASQNQNSCQLCSNYKLLLAPMPVYCSSCELRIKQNVKYYWLKDENTKTHHYICVGCYKGARKSTIITRKGSFVKDDLHMAKNDEEVEDSWVQCDTCQHWQHRICGLYNNETDLEGKAEYVCPKCCLKEIENGTRISLRETVGGAKDLPRTNLSDHIEQRLSTRLKQEREEYAKFHGIELEKVPIAEDIVVRVVVSVDKELEVKKEFRDIFRGEDYPEKVEYRSKLILLFQKIGGVDVCLFGMYVQEFGSDCDGPNNRCVYISYIDSVKYFQPERKTARGEPLRTFVYHEILIGYLEHCKKRGFASCYIWSCPLIKGEDYLFYCHPKSQKTPEKNKLRRWYKIMIKKAEEDGIVIDQTNLYDEFFIPSNNKMISAARLPYFDGDFWSDIAVNVSKTLDEEESSGKSSCSKPRTKRILMANGHETPTKDALVMQKLGDIILPEKKNCMILRLQHMCTSCNEAILSGSRWFCSQCNKIQLCSRCFSKGRMDKCGSCQGTKLSEDVLSSGPVDTKDNDDVLLNNFFHTRDDFLNKCLNSLYQFDTLGHAKYSSMMILHHFRQNLVVEQKGDTCNVMT